MCHDRVMALGIDVTAIASRAHLTILRHYSMRENTDTESGQRLPRVFWPPLGTVKIGNDSTQPPKSIAECFCIAWQLASDR